MLTVRSKFKFRVNLSHTWKKNLKYFFCTINIVNTDFHLKKRHVDENNICNLYKFTFVQVQSFDI